MTCPHCGHAAYRLLSFCVPPEPWEPCRAIEYEAETHAVRLTLGGREDVTVCGRPTSGATVYPETADADWTARLVGCEQCAHKLRGAA